MSHIYIRNSAGENIVSIDMETGQIDFRNPSSCDEAAKAFCAQFEDEA